MVIEPFGLQVLHWRDTDHGGCSNGDYAWKDSGKRRLADCMDSVLCYYRMHTLARNPWQTSHGYRGSRSTSGNDQLCRALGRNLGKIVSALPLFIGFAWAFFSKSSDAWHDSMATAAFTNAADLTQGKNQSPLIFARSKIGECPRCSNEGFATER